MGLFMCYQTLQLLMPYTQSMPQRYTCCTFEPLEVKRRRISTVENWDFISDFLELHPAWTTVVDPKSRQPRPSVKLLKLARSLPPPPNLQACCRWWCGSAFAGLQFDSTPALPAIFFHGREETCSHFLPQELNPNIVFHSTMIRGEFSTSIASSREEQQKPQQLPMCACMLERTASGPGGVGWPTSNIVE